MLHIIAFSWPRNLISRYLFPVDSVVAVFDPEWPDSVHPYEHLGKKYWCQLSMHSIILLWQWVPILFTPDILKRPPNWNQSYDDCYNIWKVFKNIILHCSLWEVFLNQLYNLTTHCENNFRYTYFSTLKH